jgi:hypothetical protein
VHPGERRPWRKRNILLTARELTADDRARLNGHILTALPKHGFSKAWFLSEVHRAIHPSEHGR